jgi:hypothetical protein
MTGLRAKAIVFWMVARADLTTLITVMVIVKSFAGS